MIMCPECGEVMVQVPEEPIEGIIADDNTVALDDAELTWILECTSCGCRIPWEDAFIESEEAEEDDDDQDVGDS